MKNKKNMYIIILIIILLTIMLVIVLKPKEEKEVKKITNIKQFEFYYTEGYEVESNVRYKIDCDYICTATIKPYGVSDEEKKVFEVDEDFMNSFIDIMNKYDVLKWDGFKKSDQNVLDGDSFSFYLKTKDNILIESSGYMMWPNNYSSVRKELDTLFNSIFIE